MKKFLRDEEGNANALIGVLKLPWTHAFAVSDPSPQWKTKVYSVQILSKLGHSFAAESILEILDLCLQDEAEDVVVEAIISMPIIVLSSGLAVMSSLFGRLK